MSDFSQHASSGCQVRHKHGGVACHTGKSDSGGRRGLARDFFWRAFILDHEHGVSGEVMPLGLELCGFAGIPLSSSLSSRNSFSGEANSRYHAKSNLSNPQTARHERRPRFGAKHHVFLSAVVTMRAFLNRRNGKPSSGINFKQIGQPLGR